MSWIKLKSASDIKKGDVLTYDSASSTYIRATNMNTPLYVAMNDSEQAEDSFYYVKGKIQGQIEAKASRDIPEEGGFIAVENGAIYVDNNMDSCGIIWQNFIDAPARKAGDLITITLR